METTSVVDGKIAIPLPIREKLGIKEATRIHIQMDAANQQIILTPITRGYINSLRGKYRGKPLLETLMAGKKRERELCCRQDGENNSK